MGRHNRLLAYSELDSRRKTYRVRYRDRMGERHTVSSGIPDTRDGRVLVKSLVSETQKKLDNKLIGVTDSNVSASDTFEYWLRERSEFTAKTVESMRNSMKSLLKRVQLMSDFVPSEPKIPGTLAQWRDDMRAGKGFKGPCSQATIYRRLGDAKNWLKWCGERGIISGDMFAYLKNPQPRSTATFLEDAEIDALEAACGADQRFTTFLAVYRLGWSCGLREGEIFNARAENLTYQEDGSGLLLLTQTKSKGKTKSRVVPVPPETMALLGSKRSGPLVPSIKFPERGWQASGLQFWWREAKKAAGITRKLPFHSTRHTFAKKYLQHGGQEGDLAQLLGHEGTDMIHEVYGHWAISTLVARAKNVTFGQTLAGHRRDKLTMIEVTGGDKKGQAETSAEGTETTKAAEI